MSTPHWTQCQIICTWVKTEKKYNRKLPSTKQVKYYHAAAGFPTKAAWIKAIKAGIFAMWPMLETSSEMKYYPESNETWKAHMHQTKQGVQSTKTQVIWAKTKGAGDTSQGWQHQTYNIHQSNRMIPSNVQSRKQILHGPLQNRWKPHTGWTNEK